MPFDGNEQSFLASEIKPHPTKGYEYRERFLNLIRVLDKQIKARGRAVTLGVEKRKFNMETWDCGSAACAAGSCGLDPWFMEHGFITYTHDHGIGSITYGGEHDFYACMRFFGISMSEADFLFDVGTYDDDDGAAVSPTTVKARVIEVMQKQDWNV